MNKQEFNQATFVNIMLVLLVVGIWNGITFLIILSLVLLFMFYKFMGEI